LIEGLRGVKASNDEKGRETPASVDNNGNVTPESLHEYVYHKVANEANQTPKIKSDKSSWPQGSLLSRNCELWWRNIGEIIAKIHY
jgi:hypothetical protein